MNIIEYIWDAVQRAVQKRSPSPLTPTDLWTALQDSWCQLPPALLQTVIECLRRRVAALLRARLCFKVSDYVRNCDFAKAHKCIIFVIFSVA
ncbi:transposable element tcb2 transposase [Trichonephila clavipes]|nr:transposable element tcb2 transposase [Trichonephila clavipes]